MVERITTHPQVGDGWLEPPITSGPSGLQVPTGRFELPVTDVLETPGRPADAEFGEFLVLVLGFTLGLRLNVEGTGHLRRAAIRDTMLVNFLPGDREILHVLGRACDFWDAHPPEVRRLGFGAVHWHLSSQSYEAQHEEFAWAYTALDGLHRLGRLTSPSYEALATGNGTVRKSGTGNGRAPWPRPSGCRCRRRSRAAAFPRARRSARRGP